ncbi:Formamidopyrimidine-DNA glycosylase N-terminal domain-containing protein [Bombardia bombarda]|uniref:Formamidopyrimidine-DNA glycosylase N-terminal domain-containing protein n=1 Tax=Bombardia bombarda TaxID=252184 RepID=A0AA40C928_9PEZI|nr:Formamidopyrimidine-DNA glycosylase N-terminal domain-containing protein [Bombardia bombarda]
MPEIAEIARIVHYLRLHLVGKTIKKATAIDDANVFGKVGTTGSEVAAALTGKKVISAGTQGKYFWLVLDHPPHPVMHFGMTGWIHIKGEQTAYTNYYKKMKPDELDVWPPKYWKFKLQTEDPTVEIAFTDSRRFGRVRLVDCPGETIRKHSPLVENGPDPVVDINIFTEDYLKKKMRSRHVPIKALLLDQATISGIGNWVGDEVLYHAKLHPEQYCDDFDDAQIKTLYESIRFVCQLAVDKLGDSDQFPEDWLFNYRWGKGTKGATSRLPNGENLAFLTVGGRTSCFAPNVQKKTGRVVPGVKEEPLESEPEEKVKVKKAAKPKTAKSKVAKEADEEDQPIKRKHKTDEDEMPAKKVKSTTAKGKSTMAKQASARSANVRLEQDKKENKKTTEIPAEAGRRRSGRLQGR